MSPIPTAVALRLYKDWHITMASVGRKQTEMTGGKATDFQ